MRLIYRGFNISAPSQFTANLLNEVEIVEEYGLESIVLVFSNTSTKTLNVVLNFLFEEPADYFWQHYNLTISDDLHLTSIPFNIGTVIDMDYVFDNESDFIAFERDFIHDRVIEIKPKS